MVNENIPLSEALYEISIFLGGFVTLYILLSLTFSYLSGWQTLRAVHGVKKISLVRSWSLQWALFDTGNILSGIFGRYRNCLSFGYSVDGIYLSGFPFVLFHRPILIPWKDAVVTSADGGFLLYSVAVPTVSISIPKNVYDGLIASQRVENTNSLLGT